MLFVIICRFVLNKLLSVFLYGSLLTKCFTLNKCVVHIIMSKPKKKKVTLIQTFLCILPQQLLPDGNNIPYWHQ
jgi:hypothetical protein